MRRGCCDRASGVKGGKQESAVSSQIARGRNPPAALVIGALCCVPLTLREVRRQIMVIALEGALFSLQSFPAVTVRSMAISGGTAALASRMWAVARQPIGSLALAVAGRGSTWRATHLG
jgi:hypothetical protein